MKNDRGRRGQQERGARVDEMAWKQRQHEQMRWEQQLRFREEELRRWEHEEFMRRSSEDRYTASLNLFTPMFFKVSITSNRNTSSVRVS